MLRYKFKEVNKHVALLVGYRQRGDTVVNVTHQLVPNPYTWAKAIVLCHYKGNVSAPYSIYNPFTGAISFNDECAHPVTKWIAALIPNPPAELLVNKDNYDDFEDIVNKIDFARYDKSLADKIVTAFRPKKRAAAREIEAEDITPWDEQT